MIFFSLIVSFYFFSGLEPVFCASKDNENLSHILSDISKNDSSSNSLIFVGCAIVVVAAIAVAYRFAFLYETRTIKPNEAEIFKSSLHKNLPKAEASRDLVDAPCSLPVDDGVDNSIPFASGSFFKLCWKLFCNTLAYVSKKAITYFKDIYGI